MTTQVQTVTWIKCGTGWCPFETVDLSDIKTHGVYVIGYEQPNSIATVYVGQGDVAARLRDHRAQHRHSQVSQSGYPTHYLDNGIGSQ